MVEAGCEKDSTMDGGGMSNTLRPNRRMDRTRHRLAGLAWLKTSRA